MKIKIYLTSGRTIMVRDVKNFIHTAHPNGAIDSYEISYYKWSCILKRFANDHLPFFSFSKPILIDMTHIIAIERM